VIAIFSTRHAERQDRRLFEGGRGLLHLHHEVGCRPHHSRAARAGEQERAAAPYPLTDGWGEGISHRLNPHHPAMRVGDLAVLDADQPLAHFRRHLPDPAGADGEFARV